jgi:hypothetical protein
MLMTSSLSADNVRLGAVHQEFWIGRLKNSTVLAYTLANSRFRYISNDAGRVKVFFYFSCTPQLRKQSRSCSADDSLQCRFFLHVQPASIGPVSLHRFGVAHQTSLRSRWTTMIYSNSLRFREAAGPFSASVHCRAGPFIGQAFPHGHHRFSAAELRGGRIRCSQSDRAT